VSGIPQNVSKLTIANRCFSIHDDIVNARVVGWNDFICSWLRVLDIIVLIDYVLNKLWKSYVLRKNLTMLIQIYKIMACC